MPYFSVITSISNLYSTGKIFLFFLNTPSNPYYWMCICVYVNFYIGKFLLSVYFNLL